MRCVLPIFSRPPELIFWGMCLLITFSGCHNQQEALVLTPHIEGAEFVGNETCKTCHEHYVREFAASPHGQFHHTKITASETAGETGCESCHGPGSRHVATGGQQKGLILNPGTSPESCLKCHVTQHSQFKFPYHHPVIEGRMNCVDCHDPHGQEIFRNSGGTIVKQSRDFCGKCHAAQSRPFVFEHAGMSDGCQTCHQPHGSPNRKLLTAPGPNLCLKCHAQIAGPGASTGNLFIGAVDHSSFLSQGTCWSAGCHTAIHGSNVQPTLLY